MKIRELKKILENLDDDADVAVIDIEGEMIPLEPQIVVDKITNAVGINSDFFHQADNWAGNEGEWSEESWEEFKDQDRLQDVSL